MRQSITAFIACTALAVHASAADIKSVSRLAMGPDNVLFLADWKDARVHALRLPDAPARPAGTAFNILDLEPLLSAQVGGARVTVEDMVARPGTAEVYIAVTYGRAKAPALIRFTSDRQALRLDLEQSRTTSVSLRDAPSASNVIWRDLPERSFTVTDMKWRDGELFIAGLSNQDFSSSLRRVKYPFDAKQTMASIEIYHTSHNLVETRAPIRAMSFATLAGRPYLIAAYTCTPIVTIPLDDIQDGAHLRGKTIAELGYGNTPADLIPYSKTEGGQSRDYLMLLNFERGASTIPLSQVEAANAKPGIESVVQSGQLTGLEPTSVPLAGAIRIDNLDEQSFIVVRRRLEQDRLQLVTIGKELSFRMTDFVSEYAFPSYSFKGDQFQLKYIKQSQDMLLKQEGFADHIKPNQ